MIITKSISRFARNTVTLLKTIRELKVLGIDVFFEENQIHSLTAEGEVLLTIHHNAALVKAALAFKLGFTVKEKNCSSVVICNTGALSFRK